MRWNNFHTIRIYKSRPVGIAVETDISKLPLAKRIISNGNYQGFFGAFTVERAGGRTITTFNPVIVNGKPIILGEKYPEITGVVIVSKGAGNLTVKMAILNAATTVLGVPASKVQILSQ